MAQKIRVSTKKSWNRPDEITTTTNVVFEPKNMSCNELFEGTRKIAKEYHKISQIMRRFYKTIENTRSWEISLYVLQRNLRYRERYKNQFNF